MFALISVFPVVSLIRVCSTDIGGKMTYFHISSYTFSVIMTDFSITSVTPERGGRGKHAPLLSFTWGAGGATVLFLKSSRILFHTLIRYSGNQISYINKQNMIGIDGCLYSCVKYRFC